MSTSAYQRYFYFNGGASGFYLNLFISKLHLSHPLIITIELANSISQYSRYQRNWIKFVRV